MKYILISVLVLLSLDISAQKTDSLNKKKDHSPKLLLDFMLVDVPYIKLGAQARANYKANVPISKAVNPKFGDYLIAPFESPSMSQVISYTSTFYNTMNYGVAKGWNKILPPNKSKSYKIFNAVGSEFTAGIAFALTTKVPFAGGWAHEEFHRNTWSTMGIGSYNHIWEFDLAPDALTYVGSVYDEDLIEFKKNDPSGFVRMGAAGIEAQYLVTERVQTQDFLYQNNLPNLALYWADFIAAIDYVNRAHTINTIDEHSETYNMEPDQLKRDFTGNDFTAWVYDLHNSEEDYVDRGIHPTGTGIDRYRDYNDLTDNMLDYVEKMGNRQWLNLVNPFMFRFREIKITESLGANFAVRHYLTSFGDDTQLDLFINRNNNKSSLTLHKYSNHSKEWLPGLEFTKYLSFTKLHKNRSLTGNFRAMAWVQPEDQLFFSDNGQVGGLVSLQTSYHSKSPFQPYIEVEAKSKGWVAGTPYLNEKVSARIGVKLNY